MQMKDLTESPECLQVLMDLVSSRLRLAAISDRKIEKQTALVRSPQDRALKEVRVLKLMLTKKAN